MSSSPSPLRRKMDNGTDTNKGDKVEKGTNKGNSKDRVAVEMPEVVKRWMNDICKLADDIYRKSLAPHCPGNVPVVWTTLPFKEVTPNNIDALIDSPLLVLEKIPEVLCSEITKVAGTSLVFKVCGPEWKQDYVGMLLKDHTSPHIVVIAGSFGHSLGEMIECFSKGEFTYSFADGEHDDAGMNSIKVTVVRPYMIVVVSDGVELPGYPKPNYFVC